MPRGNSIIIIPYMRKLIAYMITWTTYGTWLQGDERKYVKDGQTHGPNPNLEKSNLLLLKQQIIKLTSRQKITAQNAILKEAKRINHKIYAIAVYSNHIHIVAENNRTPINQMVSRYKNVATAAIKRTGHDAKLWTKGYDKRFCFTEKQLRQKIEYVNKHNIQTTNPQASACAKASAD
jgi:REP element-mobilizing transposase RayT